MQLQGVQRADSAQPTIEQRLPGLDLLGFEQQRAQLPGGGLHLNVPYLLTHRHAAGRGAVGGKVGQNPLAYVHAFTDIQQAVVLAIKVIHPGPIR